MHTMTEMKRQTGRIEELVAKLESSADQDSLATARELVQSVMELYSAGLERVAEILARKGEIGRQILEELGRDELAGNLLAANGLHPQALEGRVRRALDKLRARLGAHGSIDLLSLGEGILRLRVRASGSLKLLVEEAMYEAAPDLIEVTIEEIDTAASGFVPLEKLMGHHAGVHG